jgi:hypothetical protein
MADVCFLENEMFEAAAGAAGRASDVGPQDAFPRYQVVAVWLPML